MIKELDRKLINILDTIPLGLTTGKMGLAIYFYYMGREKQKKEYTKTGERLLDDIWKDIKNIDSINVKDGLAGIGLGISYLIKNKYVKGNINTVLQDVDDEIFKQLSYLKYTDTIDSLSLIHILHYLCERCASQKAASEFQWLYQELIIQTVNMLYQKYVTDLFEEPYIYTTDYQLPLFLSALAQIYRLQYYNYRVVKILEEITPKLLSTFPLLHANRLFLLWGMESVNKVVEIEGWKKHIELLRRELSIKHILTKELRNKNIFFSNGVSSIYCLLFDLMNYFTKTEIVEYMANISDKIQQSSIWNMINNDMEYFKRHLGLYKGYTVVTIIESLITNQLKI